MSKKNRRAIIIEEDCIGCNRCVSYCPVDCIIGAPKMLHNILEQECIGCGLCIDPCPVDCIIIQEIAPLSLEAQDSLANIAKQRHKHKILRQQEQQQLFITYRSKEEQVQDMQSEISAAIARKKTQQSTLKIYGCQDNS